MSDQVAAFAKPTPQRLTILGSRGVAAGLAIGMLALGLMFYPEGEAAVRTWIQSTAYNHCFLVVPIAAWLLWERRAALSGLTAAPMPAAALLILPLAAIWLAAERLGIMEGRQLVLISMLEVLFLGVLGWRLYNAMMGPLLYLYFLVPFGEFLTPKLQDLTTWFSRHGLEILGIPAYIDGYIIEIPQGTFMVAEACAGLRFLIASIAFGALYALMMYRSPVKRAVFIAVSIVVPIVANGFRALGIVVLGNILGSAEAAAADHVLYGWIFFSIVILMLIAIGLPFREDDRPEPENKNVMLPDPGAPRRGIVAAVAVTVLAAFGPGIGMALNKAAAAPDIALKPFALAPNCQLVGDAVPPAGRTPGRAMVQRINCGGLPMDLHVEVFSPRTTAGPVTAERRRLTRLPEAEDVTDTPLFENDAEKSRTWRVIAASHPAYMLVSGLWVEGKPVLPGLSMRLEMARTSLMGAAGAPVLIVITPIVDWALVSLRQRDEMFQRLMSVVADHPEIAAEIVPALSRSVR